MSCSIVPIPGDGSGRVPTAAGAVTHHLWVYRGGTVRVAFTPHGGHGGVPEVPGGGGGSEPGCRLVVDVVGVVPPHRHRLRLAEGAAAAAGVRAGEGRRGEG